MLTDVRFAFAQSGQRNGGVADLPGAAHQPSTAQTCGGPEAREDGELARLVSRGDRSAAAALIERHQPAVLGFLRKLTGRADLAEDLAQDTFVRMLKNAHRYDPQYPMRRWLLTIARRLSINHGRRAERRTVATEFEGMGSSDLGPSELVERADERAVNKERVTRALSQLNATQRAVIVLFYQEGRSIEEVSRITKMPAGTIKSHLHRGRAAMREYLSREVEVSEG